VAQVTTPMGQPEGKTARDARQIESISQQVIKSPLRDLPRAAQVVYLSARLGMVSGKNGALGYIRGVHNIERIVPGAQQRDPAGAQALHQARKARAIARTEDPRRPYDGRLRQPA